MTPLCCCFLSQAAKWCGNAKFPAGALLQLHGRIGNWRCHGRAAVPRWFGAAPCAPSSRTPPAAAEVEVGCRGNGTWGTHTGSFDSMRRKAGGVLASILPFGDLPGEKS